MEINLHLQEDNIIVEDVERQSAALIVNSRPKFPSMDMMPK